MTRPKDMQRKSILRPEQKIGALIWIVVAAIGGAALLIDLIARWMQ